MTLAERYAVEDIVGQGTFGRVFRAQDLADESPVALKEFVRERGRSSSFLRELGVLFELDHEAVMGCHSLLMSGQFRYLVCEYLEGGSLRDHLVERRGSTLENLLLLRHAATGVAYAHRRNIVHRDLKPENILLTGSAGALHAKVTDFGLATLISSAAAKSSIGSPAYMAPEQFYDCYDHRVDIYALGVIAYEIICGRRPFYGSPAQIMMAQVRERPRPPAWLPEGFVALFERALAKEPDDRYQTVDELIAALDDAITDLDEGDLDGRWPVVVGKVDELAVSATSVLVRTDDHVRRYDGAGRLLDEHRGVQRIQACEAYDAIRYDDRLVVQNPVTRFTVPRIPTDAVIRISAEGAVACLRNGGLTVIDGPSREVRWGEGEGIVDAAFVGQDQELWVLRDSRGGSVLQQGDRELRLPAPGERLVGHTERSEAIVRVRGRAEELLLIEAGRVVKTILQCGALTCDGDNFHAVDGEGKLATINVRSMRVARTQWDSPLSRFASARGQLAWVSDEGQLVALEG